MTGRTDTTANMAAYEYVLAGKILHHKSNREANVEALRALGRAIELDPNYAHAHAWMACVSGQAWLHGWCDDRGAFEQRIVDELQIALTLDDNDADVHRILAALKLNFNEHDKAAYHQERALSLNPNSDLIVVQQGEVLTWLGRPEEGIEWIGGRCGSIPIIRSAFGAISAARNTLPALTPRRSPPTASSLRPTTRITRFWRRRRRGSATAQRLALTPTRCCRGSRRFRLRPSSARCIIGIPPMGSTCARAS